MIFKTNYQKGKKKMYLRGNYWHYDFIVDKQRYRGSTGFTKNEKRLAQQMADDIKFSLRHKKNILYIWKKVATTAVSEKISLNSHDIWSFFIIHAQIKAGPQRRKIYFSRLKEFCIFMQKNYPDIKFTHHLTEIHSCEYRKYLEKLNVSYSTKNDHLAALKMIFRILSEHDIILNNIFLKIKKFKCVKVKREIFSPDELKTILKRSESWMHHLFITALFTGLREGDICLLQKSEIDKNYNWITIEKTRKTGVRVDIPILPQLREHLKMIPENDSIYVYPELAERYLENPKSIGREVKKFLEAAGISGCVREVSGYKNRVSVKDIHSFRHTFIYMAALGNTPLPVIKSIAGHSSEKMTCYYMDHVSRKDKEILKSSFKIFNQKE